MIQSMIVRGKRMKKIFAKAIAGILTTSIVLTGCGLQRDPELDKEVFAEASVESVSDDESTVAATEEAVEETIEASSTDDAEKVYEDITGYDSTEMMDGETLTEDELKSFRDYFNLPKNYIYTIPQYRTPDMIDVKGVTADADRPEIVCLEGVRKGDMIQIVVSYLNSIRYNRRVTLVETDDADQPYKFYSCRQLWEDAADKIIEAPIYGTDETVTCGVINKFDPWTTEIDIIEDNAVSNIVSLSPYIGTENKASDEVKEIAFCDIDKDGDDELIAICVYGDETRAILCGGHPDKEGKIDYNEWKEGYSMWLRDNVGDITADKVIDYILEHQDEFNTI